MKHLNTIIFAILGGTGIILFAIGPNGPLSIPGIFLFVISTFFLYRWIPSMLTFLTIVFVITMSGGGPEAGLAIAIYEILLMILLIIFSVVALIIGKVIRKKINENQNLKRRTI
jgi:hypothetical protein